jgi:SAM-dependent methyltransferase
VDIVCELTHFPWPVADGSADRLLFSHSIQYLGPFAELLKEIRRACKDGAEIEIRAPHFSSYNYFSDPLYMFPLAWRTFDFWSPVSHFPYDYRERDGLTLEVLERQIVFNSGVNPWRWLGVQALVNRFPRVYERFFAFLLPAQEIRFKLRLTKHV